MRIAVSGYIGPTKTGIGVVTQEFMSRLIADNAKGHDYFVFVNHDTELRLPESEHLHVIPYPVSRKNALGNLLWTALVYPWQCARYRVDLSIIPNVTWLIFKFCPTIVIIHDLIEFQVPAKFGRARMLYRRIAVPMTARRADHIVTDSRASAHDLVSALDTAPEKITVIYPGVRTLPFERAQATLPRERYDLPGEYILYVGTVDHPGKNGMALLKVYQALPADLRERLDVVFAGRPGPGFEHLEREAARAGIQSHVRFLGFVAEGELPALYANCQVFLFPSRYEGFGLPVIEAMYCGAPVITAANSALIEAAGDAALLFDADDTAGMARAVERIVREPEFRAALVARGYQHARRFSWENNSAQWRALLARWNRARESAWT